MNAFRILLILVIFLTLNSCHHDREDEAVSVQYRVMVEGQILKAVTYKSANGEVNTVDPHPHVDIWHTTEFADSDFEAHLVTEFVNESNNDEPYKLSCFVEGELVSVKEGIVSPLSEKTEEIKYFVEN